MHLSHLLPLFAAAAFATGCVAASTDSSDSTEGAIREDAHRAPLVMRVPVRFTQNDVSDVGYAFSSSWLPLTSVKREALDGYTWGYSSASSAEKIAGWAKPDMPGAGYLTAWFSVSVPYDTDGHLAYGLTRVKLESQFLNTEMTSSATRKYSPLRVRAGSDQPCLSVTMQGALDGKFKAVPVPFTDEGFTERDWKVGDTDADGVPIKTVIVGSLQFSAYCWPENVEGKTGVSGGVGVPGVPAFVMVDKSSGEGGAGSATVYVNLIENEKGKVSLGDAFSTNAGVLGERDRAKFDDAVGAFGQKFTADMNRGEQDAANAPMPIGP